MPTTHTTTRNRRGTPRLNTSARIAVEDQVLSLREGGMSFAQIAVTLGSYPQIVGTHYRNAIARHNSVTRSFGIEIELKGLSCHEAAVALRGAGLVAYDTSYSHEQALHWKVVLDGSVSGGCEAVSPILSGEAGLAQIMTAMNALREAGATVDTSCGMHVHVDARDLTGDEFARTFGFYTERQDLFDALVAPSRRRNTYCAKYSPDQIMRIKEAARRDKSEAGYAASNRYMTVNVESYGRHGTIEFRQHQGTLNGAKATAWARLLLAIVVKVQANAEEEISGTDLPAMIDGLGLPVPTATYLKTRATRLTV